LELATVSTWYIKNDKNMPSSGGLLIAGAGAVVTGVSLAIFITVVFAMLFFL